jgi:hypothetical protein
LNGAEIDSGELNAALNIACFDVVEVFESE